MTLGARAALQERMKRNVPRGALSPSARVRRIWCMVGTPENQVASCSWATGQKLLALNRLGTMFVPPLARVEKSTPISPCTWNKGMIISALSSSERP